MEYFQIFMSKIFDFMKVPITVWGFTFSYWDIFLLTILASLIGYFVREVFD